MLAVAAPLFGLASIASDQIHSFISATSKQACSVTIFDADEKMWLLLKLYRELVVNREPHVITS